METITPASTALTSAAAHAIFADPAALPTVDFFGNRKTLLVGGAQTAGEFALMSTSGERGHSCPWHRHRGASETFIVLDGELLFDVDGEQHVSRSGHTAVLPRDVPHGFVVVSESARWLTLHTPAGFEEFVREVSDAVRTDDALDFAALCAIALRHDVELLGPGVALPETAP